MFTAGLVELEGLADRAAELASSFDAAALAAHDAPAVVALTTRIERAANAIRLQAAAVVAESGTWRGSGHRSEADWFASTTGKSHGEAAADVATGKALRDLPRTAAAVADGQLSPAAAREIADAATVAPGAEAALLEQAGLGLPVLRNACKEAKAAADPDPEARRARIDGARSCTRRDEADGTAVLTLRGTPDRIGRMIAKAEHDAQTRAKAARKAGVDVPFTAHVFDAIEAQQLSAGDGRPLPVGADAKIIFRVDWDAYQRGHAHPDELCEIVGVGRVAVSVVREAAEHAFIAAVVTQGTDIRLVTHLGRKPTVLQTTALQFRSPTCVVAGCVASARLETEHPVDWTLTRVTNVEFLELECYHHHDLKTRYGWAVEPRATAPDPEQRALIRPRPGDPPPATKRGRTDVVPELVETIRTAIAQIKADRAALAGP